MGADEAEGWDDSHAGESQRPDYSPNGPFDQCDVSPAAHLACTIRVFCTLARLTLDLDAVTSPPTRSALSVRGSPNHVPVIGLTFSHRSAVKT